MSSRVIEQNLGQECNPALLQGEWVNAALEGPIVRAGDEFGSNGVVSKVVPFFRVALVVPELAVPVVSLPDGCFLGPRPVLGSFLPPPFHPVLQRQ